MLACNPSFKHQTASSISFGGSHPRAHAVSAWERCVAAVGRRRAALLGDCDALQQRVRHGERRWILAARAHRQATALQALLLLRPPRTFLQNPLVDCAVSFWHSFELQQLALAVHCSSMLEHLQ